MLCSVLSYFYFFFNDTATTEIYTLSLHDALPIWRGGRRSLRAGGGRGRFRQRRLPGSVRHRLRPLYPLSQQWQRSEEHTSELQSRQYLVCRLLLEKKKIKRIDKHGSN